MSTTAIVLIVVIVVLVLLALAALAWTWQRRRALQQQFGPEYDHAVRQGGSHRAADRELRDRLRRHDELQLRSLSPDEVQQFRLEWNQIQARFVDDPASAVNAGDDFIGRVMAARGYPIGGTEERTAALSVDHASTLSHYREAHVIRVANEQGAASTEQLRQAVVHYRALADDLLGKDDAAVSYGRGGQYTDGATDAGAAERPTEVGTAERPTEVGTAELPTEVGTAELPTEVGAAERPTVNESEARAAEEQAGR